MLTMSELTFRAQPEMIGEVLMDQDIYSSSI